MSDADVVAAGEGAAAGALGAVVLAYPGVAEADRVATRGVGPIEAARGVGPGLAVAKGHVPSAAPAGQDALEATAASVRVGPA